MEMIDPAGGDLREVVDRRSDRAGRLVVGAAELAETCLQVESADARAAVDPSLVVAVRNAWDSAREAIDVELHAHP